MTVLLPFTPVDELGCHVDSAAEPNGIHLEVLVDGHLEVARLRAAVLATLAAHPLARARRARWRGWHRRFTWEIADVPEEAPLDEVRWRTEDELAGHRESLLAATPPLDLGPPVRFRHAVGPDQDVLVLDVHHAAMDGMSCLRLLRSVTRRYAGLPDPHVADPLAVRAVAGRPATGGTNRHPRQATRIAPDTAAPGPGCGFHLVSLPLGVRNGLGKSATVNDVLIAALMLAVETWNREHGRDTGTVRVTMPVNARATPGAEEPLGNLSRLTVVTGVPARRHTPDGLLAEVTGQTAAAKLLGGPQIDAVSRLFATPWLPVTVKARLLALARRLISVGDTAMLSNLGKVDGSLDFGPDTATVGVWFSPPVRMPAGVAVGVVTLDGRLNLCFRYRHALLDPPTAARFATTFRTALDSLDDPRLTRSG
jgi:NRPS condensation-like uncharacterized protein